MKPYLVIVAIIVSAFTGCKLDEAGFNDNAPAKNELLGMWYIKYQRSFTPSLPQLGDFIVTDFTDKDYYKFGADNICTFSVSNPPVIITSNYTYDALAKKIIFGPDDEDVFTVSKLTSDSLVVQGIASAEANGQVTITNLTIKFARK
jgi:hypothetical protein